MEWLVEKLTELGINSITPIICEHSERKVIKTERLKKICISLINLQIDCIRLIVMK